MIRLLTTLGAEFLCHNPCVLVKLITNSINDLARSLDIFPVGLRLSSKIIFCQNQSGISIITKSFNILQVYAIMCYEKNHMLACPYFPP